MNLKLKFYKKDTNEQIKVVGIDLMSDSDEIGVIHALPWGTTLQDMLNPEYWKNSMHLNRDQVFIVIE